MDGFHSAASILLSLWLIICVKVYSIHMHQTFTIFQLMTRKFFLLRDKKKTDSSVLILYSLNI